MYVYMMDAGIQYSKLHTYRSATMYISIPLGNKGYENWSNNY